MFQAEALLKTMPLLEYYEDVALPALALAQIDVTRSVLERSRQVEVCESVERVVADLSDHVDLQETDAGAAPPPVLPATIAPVVAEEQSLKNKKRCFASRGELRSIKPAARS
jgi:hypothetical protein